MQLSGEQHGSRGKLVLLISGRRPRYSRRSICTRGGAVLAAPWSLLTFPAVTSWTGVDPVQGSTQNPAETGSHWNARSWTPEIDDFRMCQSVSQIHVIAWTNSKQGRLWASRPGHARHGGVSHEGGGANLGRNWDAWKTDRVFTSRCGEGGQSCVLVTTSDDHDESVTQMWFLCSCLQSMVEVFLSVFSKRLNVLPFSLS